jgi:hypothetical protein
MKRDSVSTLFFFFALWVCGCESAESTRLAGPSMKVEPTVEAAEAVDSTYTCNVTLLTKGEASFPVAGGGLGAIALRDVIKTSTSFVRYAAYEIVLSGTDAVGLCLDLHEKPILPHRPSRRNVFPGKSTHRWL